MEQLKTVVDEMHSAVGPGCGLGASGRSAGARLVGRVVSLAVDAALWTGISVAQECVVDLVIVDK